MSVVSALLLPLQIAIVAFVARFCPCVQAGSRRQQASTTRRKPVHLASARRRSSNDRSRPVRRNVVTEDADVQRPFDAVRGIRAGSRPRPADCSPSYWNV